MNFATLSTGGAGVATHFVTSGGQLPVAKMQQNITANGTGMPQVVGVVGGDGVQYVRALDGGATLQTTPQVITLPIALPGAKPGDPQPTVQIQVLSPNLTIQQQQQPKFQMQIPIQGFQQGGAVLTLAYSPENNEGIQFLGNSLPEGLQVLATLPQDLQLLQHAQELTKEQQLTALQQQFFLQSQQIMMNEEKNLNNNMSPNNNSNQIEIKEECDDNTNDEESSQGIDGSNDSVWQNNTQDIVNYLNKLPPQQTQTLPVSLQQFLKLNSVEMKKENCQTESMKSGENTDEAIVTEDGQIQIKKKKRYKKKPQKPPRQKPGQVIIATGVDGTPLYCCPECQLAYSDKEQLELHLAVHKIERRFICGICGAGLKRKEHLERHKLGHNPERPYICAICRKGFKRREHLNLHTVIHSGIKTEVCQECGKGFYRKDHLRKHTKSHETRRAREEALGGPGNTTNTGNTLELATITPMDVKTNIGETILPEITIHVPTSGNVQVPVQINIPQHVMTSLAAQQAAAAAAGGGSGGTATSTASSAQAQLEAILAQHQHS